jgi:hypothetical protein
MDDKFIELAQRITSLEAKFESDREDKEEFKQALDSLRAGQRETNKELSTLNNKITKWEGKFGGVIFVLTCLWAFLSGAAAAVMDWIKLMGGIK